MLPVHRYLSLLLLAACVPSGGPGVPRSALREPPAQPNLLVLLLDDVGVDAVATYEASDDAADTPTLDTLAAEGVAFRHATAMPNCSATRAALLTGQPPYATGIGGVLGCPNKYGLGDAPETIAERLGSAGYATAAFGKWHLAQIAVDLDVETTDPLRHGFGTYVGNEHGMGNDCTTDGQDNHHTDWERCDDGACERITAFSSTQTTDDVLAWTSEQDAPWLAWVGFNAAHAPYENPPEDLMPAVPVGDTSEGRKYRNLVHATDQEISRLLAGIDVDDTIVFVLGDNGTPDTVVMRPFSKERAKASIYSGGTDVPLVVSGPGLGTGWVDDALISVTDVYATLAELGGAPIDPSHGAWATSRSFTAHLLFPTLPVLEPCVYAERFSVNEPPAEWIDRKSSYSQAVQCWVDSDGDGLDELWKWVRQDTCLDEETHVCVGAWHTIDELYAMFDARPEADQWPDNDALVDGTSPEEQVVLDFVYAWLAERGVPDPTLLPEPV